MASNEQLRRTDQPIGTVQVVIASDAVRVILAGEVDVELDNELDEAARAVREHPLPVIVDATRVTFMDSAGVRFIARFYGQGRLTVSASPTVRFLLQVLGMDDVVTRPDRI